MFVSERSMNGNYESEAGSLTAPKVRPYPSPGRQAWVSVPHRIQGLKARHKMNAGKEIGRLDRISFSPLRYEIFVPDEPRVLSASLRGICARRAACSLGFATRYLYLPEWVFRRRKTEPHPGSVYIFTRNALPLTTRWWSPAG